MMLSVIEMGGVFPLAGLNERNYLSWSLKMERKDLWTVVSNPPADLNEEQQK